MTYDIAFLDEDGNHLCTVEAFEVALHGESSLQEPTCRFDVGYEYISLDLSSCLRPILEESSIPNQARDVSPGDTCAGTLPLPHKYKYGKGMELHAQLLALDVTASYIVYLRHLLVRTEIQLLGLSDHYGGNICHGQSTSWYSTGLGPVTT